MTDFTSVKEFILKYKVNQTQLALNIGIAPPTFRDKMKGGRYAKFTPEQQEKIIQNLKKMGEEIQKL